MLELIEVKPEEKQTLLNLMEKYLCEFSQWEKTDVNENGLYEYEWIDYYFTEKERFPYFIKIDGKLAGFILISNYPEVPEEVVDFCLSEFFILPKYRRTGYGKEEVFKVLDLHHGKWQLKRHPHNLASVYFWDKVLDEYTNGNFRLVRAFPNKEVNYDDGTPADVFFFDN